MAADSVKPKVRQPCQVRVGADAVVVGDRVAIPQNIAPYQGALQPAFFQPPTCQIEMASLG